MESVSFDRAADYYDATRALPDDARNAVTDVLSAELAGRGPCLEIGVGTGRISLPLHERGIQLAGADISEAMMRKLIENAGGTRPFPLLLADATRLPLADEAFGAVLACHVLHLIADWRSALDETMRVLRPGGVFLAAFAGRSGGGTGPYWRQGVREALARHGVSRDRIGTRSAEDVASHLTGVARQRALPPVTVTETLTLRDTVEALENQINSWTWPFSADEMHEVGADIRSWADREGVPLDEQVPATEMITWQAFQRPE